MSAAPGVDHRQLRPGWRLVDLLRFHTDHPRQLAAGWVRALADHCAIEQDEGKALVPVLPQRSYNDFVRRECLRLLCQVVTFNGDALVRQPLQVGGKSNQSRIYAGSTYSCGTAHRGIKYLNLSHVQNLK
jgi:hypothetical protein